MKKLVCNGKPVLVSDEQHKRAMERIKAANDFVKGFRMDYITKMGKESHSGYYVQTEYDLSASRRILNFNRERWYGIIEDVQNKTIEQVFLKAFL